MPKLERFIVIDESWWELTAFGPGTAARWINGALNVGYQNKRIGPGEPMSTFVEGYQDSDWDPDDIDEEQGRFQGSRFRVFDETQWTVRAYSATEALFLFRDGFVPTPELLQANYTRTFLSLTVGDHPEVSLNTIESSESISR
jgi:hypothetical protein